MTSFSQLALALPLSVALAFANPVQAAQWLDFSITFTGKFDDSVDGTLTGRTQDGDSAFGTDYTFGSLQDLQFSIETGPAQSVLLYNGDVFFSTGSGPNDRQSNNVTLNFADTSTVSFSGPLYFTLGSAWDTSGSVSQTHLFWDPVRGLLTGAGFESSGSVFPQTVAPDQNTGTFTKSADVRVVPEINGSGFAYIAFILGALGLWLYSGAARGRSEAMPAPA